MTSRQFAIRVLSAIENFLGVYVSAPLMRFHTRRLKTGLPALRWILLYDSPRRLIVRLRHPLSSAEFRSRVVAMRNANAQRAA